MNAAVRLSVEELSTEQVDEGHTGNAADALFAIASALRMLAFEAKDQATAMTRLATVLEKHFLIPEHQR